jgi:hypothetical protein
MATEVRGVPLTLHIHKNHERIKTMANVAGALTPILELSPADNQILYFPNGNPIVMKLYDTTGAELPPSAELVLTRVAPDGYTEVVLAKTIYQPWKLTSLENQSDPKRQGLLAFQFTDPSLDAVAIQPGYKLVIKLKADSVVAWNNANTQIFFSVGEKVRQATF